MSDTNEAAELKKPEIKKALIASIDSNGDFKIELLGFENKLEAIGLIELLNQKKVEMLHAISRSSEVLTLEALSRLVNLFNETNKSEVKG